VLLIMLPFALIGGWWLGQLRFERAIWRRVFAAACVLSAVYLLRGVSGSNYERAIDILDRGLRTRRRDSRVLEEDS
jgi:hypothetical protein